MKRIERRITVRCMRGTVAPELSCVVDAIACGDCAEQVRDAVGVFTEVERLLDRVANRMLDLAGEPDSPLPSGVVQLDDAIWIYSDLGAVALHPVSATFAALLADVEDRALRQFRTLSMSMLVAVRRSCTDLGKAVEEADESPERDAAASVHVDLLSIARTAEVGEDARHPFAKLWPRLVATGLVDIAIEQAKHHAALRAS